MGKLKSIANTLIRFSYTSPEEQLIFARYESFFKRTLYSMSTTFDDFIKIDLKNKKNSTRFTRITILKIMSFVFVLRSAINVLYPTEFVKFITCNGFHYLGDHLLINMAVLAGSLTGSLVLGFTQQYSIFSGQSYQFEYMNKIKYRRLDYRLNRRLNKKFYRKFDWISRGATILFKPTLCAVSVLICTPGFIGYFDPDIQFNPIGIASHFCLVV